MVQSGLETNLLGHMPMLFLCFVCASLVLCVLCVYVVRVLFVSPVFAPCISHKMSLPLIPRSHLGTFRKWQSTGGHMQTNERCDLLLELIVSVPVSTGCAR